MKTIQWYNDQMKWSQRDETLNQISFICTDLHKSTGIKEQVVYGWIENKKKITADILSYNSKCI